MDQFPADDILRSLVSRVFHIESVTLIRDGIFRFTGHLFSEDSAAAYDQLSDTMKPQGLTPLFRVEKNEQVIYLVKNPPKAKPSNPVINLILFGLTLLSVLLSGAIYSIQAPPAGSETDLIRLVLAHIGDGWPFAVSLLAILTSHELGHYFAGKYHHTEVTLPFFIPLPFSSFGTMGAFIQMKETPKNKRILMDIGMAGPIAGLVVCIPLLLLGLSLSHVEPLPQVIAAGQGYQIEGNSIIYLITKYLVFQRWLPEPASYGNMPHLLYWIRYLFTGAPIPLGGYDVILHPVAWAAWAGLLVTSLNLIPAGQLDGGHILYTLIGNRGMRLVYPFILGGLVLLGFLWNGWFLWAALIFLFGRSFAEPLDQITSLDIRRKWFVAGMLIIFVLVFIPIPLIIIGG